MIFSILSREFSKDRDFGDVQSMKLKSVCLFYFPIFCLCLLFLYCSQYFPRSPPATFWQEITNLAIFAFFFFHKGRKRDCFVLQLVIGFFFFFNIYFLVMLHLILGDIMGKAGKNIFKFLSFFLSGN